MKLNLPIHHIGVATRSIDKEIQLFYALGFVQEGEFVDETQGVRGVFVIPAMQTSFESKTPLDSLSQSSAALPQSATTNSPTIPYRFELLENLKNSTRLDTYLKHHQKLYHIAFATRDIQKDCKAILDSLTLESNKSSINLAGGGGGGEIKNKATVLTPHITDTQNTSTPRIQLQKPRLVIPIMNASYFAKLCFIMLPNRLLIELVELKE